MKKLIYLFFALLIFSCSSEEDDPVCLVCTNMDFLVVNPYSVTAEGTVSCAFEEGDENCEGMTTASMCFPNSVPSTATPLTKTSLNAIKLYWEERGAICTLK